MPYTYQIWDVFTDTPLAGNPLAVVFDVDDLASDRWQRVAAEFNLSETLVLGRPEGAGRWPARIFMPRGELPFAGHPTVGGAIALGSRDSADEVTFLLKAGETRCGLSEGRRRAHVRAPVKPVLEPGVPAREALAAAVGLPPATIGTPALSPARAYAGPRFTIVPLAEPADLSRVRIDRVAVAALGEAFTGVYVIAPTEAGRFACRMFAPLSGIEEDPATGSAAVAFAALWTEATAPADGTHTLTLRQGEDMGRPSDIMAAVTVEGGAVTSVELSGTAVMVAEGTLHL